MEGPDYNFLFELFSKEDIRNRIVFIYEKAEEFTKYYSETFEKFLGQKINSEEYFCVNADIVGEVAIDYFTDIYRLKKFHPIERVNSLKIAAYTTSWVLRKKPIQIIKKFTCFSDEIIRNSWSPYINESFAAVLLLSLAFDQREIIKEFDSNKYSKFQSLLIYNFVHRQYTPQSLELTLQALHANYPYSLLTDLVENNDDSHTT